MPRELSSVGLQLAPVHSLTARYRTLNDIKLQYRRAQHTQHIHHTPPPPIHNHHDAEKALQTTRLPLLDINLPTPLALPAFNPKRPPALPPPPSLRPRLYPLALLGRYPRHASPKVLSRPHHRRRPLQRILRLLRRRPFHPPLPQKRRHKARRRISHHCSR